MRESLANGSGLPAPLRKCLLERRLERFQRRVVDGQYPSFDPVCDGHGHQLRTSVEIQLGVSQNPRNKFGKCASRRRPERNESTRSEALDAIQCGSFPSPTCFASNPQM